ncbi:chemotaxis protein MotA [Aeromonas sp. RU39B]|jgi:chemotaxis protein MotA|uniref:lateral flagellar motor stator protein LafT n=1 Tax=Aeromonas sp. RU39B TaxID=1907416 RepID=UPI0009567CD0|nr:lateral flagellar motor stator protein LafT [Aeromonas sp. RU39B]SIR17357.1 chemotaxis protein MotA [Aeromonas sp. RU39B]
MQIFIGIGLVVVCVFGGFMMASGRLIALWQPSEMIIILGAGFGSMVIGNSKEVLLEMKSQLKAIVSKHPNETEVYRELLTLMYQLLDEVRLKGLKALDEHIEAPSQSSFFLCYPSVEENPLVLTFITDNFRLLSMGKISPHELESLLEHEIAVMQEDMLKPAHALHRTGEAFPGFGILAAVMGIIITMQQLDGPLSGIGVHVGAALVGTFIGIFMCYCLLEPASSAMESLVQRRIAMLECVKAIILAHLRGKMPLLAVDAGRKTMEPNIKPSFVDMEEWVTNPAM